MDFKEVVRKRRSTRRYTGKPVEVEKLRSAMEIALRAPSSKNTRSTRLMAVTNLDKVHALGRLRDWGSSLLEEASAAIVVMGDEEVSPMWQTNAAIMATVLQLALVDEGLASCWVHVNDRPCLKDEPEGDKADDYLRNLLGLSDNYGILCAVALGYSDFEPKPLPAYEGEERVIWK